MVEQGGPVTVGPGGTAIDAEGLSELINLLMDIPAGADVPLSDIAAKLATLFAVDIMVVYDVDRATSDTTPGNTFGISMADASDGLNPEAILAAAASGRTVTLGCSVLPGHLVERGVRVGACIPFARLSMVLSLYRKADIDFDAAQIEFISLVAKYVNLVLRRMRRAVQLRQLAEHSAHVGACRSERAVLDVAVDGIPRLFEADAAGVGVISDGIVQFQVHRGFGAMFDQWTGTIEQSAATSVVRERRPYRTGDIREGAPERSFWPIRAAVIVPVEVNGTVVAVLGAYRYTTRQFGTDDEYVLTVLAGQVAAAMSNAALLTEREQLRREADTLRLVSAEFNSSLSVVEVGRRIQAAMLDHSGADRVVVLLLDEDQRRLRPMGGASGRIVLAEDPAVVRALLERRPIMHESDPPPSADGARWSLVQPLAVHDRRLGVVLLEWAASLRPTPPAMVETIADMAAKALEHAQLFEHATSSGRQLTALHDVAVAMSNDDDIASTLARVVDSVREMTGAQVARIGLVDPSGDTFTTVALSGEGDRPLGTRSPMNDSVGAWVIRNATTAWVPNTAAGLSEPAEAAAWINDHTPGSAVAVPIHGRGDAPVTGFLTLRHPEPYFLGRSYLPILERFATEAGLAVQTHRETDARLALARQLRDQAAADPLTGLANRTHLLEAITQALVAASRATHTLAVLFLDLDRFKTVNDSLGHAAGDELLCAVADRISNAVRPGDLVGRLGGDEFVVVLEDVTKAGAAAEAELIAERILRAFTAPITVRQRRLFVSASIGLTVAGDSSRDADDLLRDADVAMYRAKAAGKAQVVLFEPSMNVGGLLDLEGDLRKALDEQSLRVYYQPVVELATGRPLGVEALTRWHHPRLGWVPPEEFVPLAEDTGLIRRLDHWVLQTALRDLECLRRQWPALEVNVNLSAMHLHDRGLAARVAHALTASGLPAAALTLEITETAAMWDPGRTLDSLASLQELGIGVVLDDFGTGYSNFGYLKRFPLRGIKIDQAFVEHLATDRQDAAIVGALIALSGALGLGVTAEGVETSAQQHTLLELGCRRAQGYLFSPAVPLPELVTLLRESNAATSVQPPVD